MHQNDLRPLALAARETAQRGWNVFPLVPDSKRPAIRSWELRATTDAARISPCWAAGAYNVGIATGPSKLIVIDLDRPKHDQDVPPLGTPSGVTDGPTALATLAEQLGQPYPSETYTVRTGSGGAHLYFIAPGGVALRNTAGALGWKIDTRAGGGYVVGAGSVVNGKAYTVLRDQDPAPLPEWLATLLVPAPMPPQAHRAAPLAFDGRHSAYLRSAVDQEVRRVSRAHTGNRNNALYQAAVALGQLVAGGELDADDVNNWLVPAALGIGLVADEVRSTIASGLRAGARRPRTIAHARSAA
jgi:hypothetical protein